MGADTTAVPDRFPLEVERLTYGPDALGHHGRCVVFVPFAAPGDRAEVAIEERRRGYVRAAITALRAPGPGRTTPFCPVYGRCGGCRWQHLDLATQRAAKQAVVAEQLARLGGLRDVEVRPTLGGAGRAYRARITLAVAGAGLGFHAARSHALVPVDGCPVAAPAVSAHVPVLAAWAREAAPPLASLTIAEAPAGVVAVARLDAEWDAAALARSERWLAATPSVRGLVWRSPTRRLVLGDATVHVPLEPDLHLEAPADVFTQVNPAMNPLLVASVLEAAAPQAGGRALDLYCGAGNFTLPLARRGLAVLGVEAGAPAAAAARENAARAGLAGVRIEHAEAAPALRALPSGPLDLVVLDPPRRGAADAVALLARRRPPRIVYVSCDPATLARDARRLVDAGYHIASMQPLDLFPHTHHVETVAAFRLT